MLTWNHFYVVVDFNIIAKKFGAVEFHPSRKIGMKQDETDSVPP
jgi:hypothetical protein